MTFLRQPLLRISFRGVEIVHATWIPSRQVGTAVDNAAGPVVGRGRSQVLEKECRGPPRLAARRVPLSVVVNIL